MKTFNLDLFLCEYFKQGEAVRVEAKLLQDMIRKMKNEEIKLKGELMAKSHENEGLKQTIKILKNGQESFLDLKA